MRVLAVTNVYPPDVVGGYEIACLQAVDALRGRGHDVRVLTSAPRAPVATPPHVSRVFRLTDLWDYYAEAHSDPVSLRLREVEAFQINAFNVHALLGAVEEYRPDVVYLWMLVGLGGLGLVGALHHLRVPWVWHLEDEVPAMLCTVAYEVNPGLARHFAGQLRGTYLACSRQVVDANERKGVPLLGREGVDVEMVTNWVTGDRPPPRGRFYEGGRLRVLAAASFLDHHYEKGIDILIRAAALVRDRGEGRLSLDVFGKATDGTYADLIRSLGLGDVVTLKGSLSHPEMLRAYRDYDLFAFPGRVGEPFGIAPLEALAAGCLPVLADRCGAAEWLVHGVHALKVPRTAEGFASAFGSVLGGGVAVGPVASRGQAAVWRDFHLDAQLPKIEAALARESARPRAGAGTSAEAYRLAVLAEKLAYVLVQDAHAA